MVSLPQVLDSWCLQQGPKADRNRHRKLGTVAADQSVWKCLQRGPREKGKEEELATCWEEEWM